MTLTDSQTAENVKLGEAAFESPKSELDVAAAKESEPVTVLVADDELMIRKMLGCRLKKAGYNSLFAENGRQAMELMNSNVSVAVLDVDMPEANGLECLDFIKEKYPETQVVILTASAEVSDAVSAMKSGAFEFVAKPYDPAELMLNIDKATRAAKLAMENRNYKQMVETAWPTSALSPTTDVAKELDDKVAKIAKLDSNVLITGESGTGKTTVARMIHQRGPRAKGPFVAVNCASLPRELIEAELFGHQKGAFTGAINDRPGRAEIANGGTLFLDEIGDLPIGLQPKLLTFLQDRTLQRVGSNQSIKVDVRVVVATLQDLKKMCRNKLFREDLFYRLNVLNINVPPLRQRIDEIPHLANEILRRIYERRGGEAVEISKDALNRLRLHQWPGNIRELENVLERATAFCEHQVVKDVDIVLDRVNYDSLDSDETRCPEKDVFRLVGKTLLEIEKQAIIETLEHCNGNKAMTARTLGISEKSIYNKLKRLGIQGFGG